MRLGLWPLLQSLQSICLNFGRAAGLFYATEQLVAPIKSTYSKVLWSRRSILHADQHTANNVVVSNVGSKKVGGY